MSDGCRSCNSRSWQVLIQNLDGGLQIRVIGAQIRFGSFNEFGANWLYIVIDLLDLQRQKEVINQGAKNNTKHGDEYVIGFTQEECKMKSLPCSKIKSAIKT